MQNTLQISLDESTITYTPSKQLQFRFDKDDILRRLGFGKFVLARKEGQLFIIEIPLVSVTKEGYIIPSREMNDTTPLSLHERSLVQQTLRGFKVLAAPSAWFSPYDDIWKVVPPQETPPLDETLTDIELFNHEREAFLRIKEDLLEREMHLGEFVAIHEGQVVDHDRDNVELAQRVYARYGYVPIYIDKVEREREVIELPSPEG